jgi:4-hydroxy-2-oxoheptanedioate aldolase
MSADLFDRIAVLRQCWREGQTAFNAWLMLPDPMAAEIVSHSGWDTVTIDMQHGLIEAAHLPSMLQAVSRTSAVPLVRVPWNEPGIVMKALDAGAAGIIAPMINSAEEAAALVEACRYPPKGTRSYGPVRAAMQAENYASRANEHILVFAMIETVEAFEARDRIIRTPGLDGILIGPSDLSLSMGAKPGMDPTDQMVLGAIKAIRSDCEKAGKLSAIYTITADAAREAAAQGFSLVVGCNDTAMLSAASRERLASVTG